LALPSGTRLSVYEILSPLGAGGMGEVYRAKDTKLGRDVALKILPASFTTDPERVARFRREAQVLASLNHPHIAQIYGLEDANNTQFIVLELVEGESLDKLIARGPIAVDEALGIAKQIAEALERAHEKGIIHRDLKPANIALTKDGQVKVLDFGLAKPADNTGGAVELTHSPTVTFGGTHGGVLLGTAPYMSPEQARGLMVDKRADIWAFGCVLYEMFAGRRAFDGPTPTDVFARIVERDPDWAQLPERTPVTITRLLARCLEKDPKRRLRDIGDAWFELDAVGEPPAKEARSSSTRRHTMTALVVTALMATLVLLFWIVRRPMVNRPSEEVQFTFGASDDTRLEAGAPVPSPDGARVAFVARSTSGRRSIWIRDVRSTNLRELPETADVLGPPFWSPDGRWLGFVADGRLKKIGLSGGPALTICAVQANLGATWNSDNVIVVAPVNRTVLHKVSAAGGTPEPLTTLDATRKENSHRWPSFLPDGRHFLFTARSDAIEHNLIYVGSLDSKDVKPLVAAQSNAVYAAGYLLYAREATLLAQPFDVSTLTLSGEPVPVASPIGHNTPSSSAGFGVSNDGRVLVYQAGIRPLARLTWFDRSGQAVGTVGAESDFTEVRLSPDGRLAAVVVPDRDSGNRDIWLIDLSTGTTTRFTSNPANDWQMAWTPDGRQVAFASDRNGRSSVYVKSIDGGGEELLLQLPDRGVFPKDYSKDGRLLTLGVDSPGGIPSLGAMWLDGDRKPFPIGESASSRENEAMLTRDGRWVTFVSRQSGTDEVYIAPFPKGRRRQISSGGGGQPHWKDDDSELYYVSADGAIVAVPVHGKDSLEPGTPVPLFRPCGGVSLTAGTNNYDVAVGGSRFLTICHSPAATPSAITVSVNWIHAIR
jgi:Tol biopolymer transport system component